MRAMLGRSATACAVWALLLCNVAIMGEPLNAGEDALRLRALLDSGDGSVPVPVSQGTTGDGSTIEEGDLGAVIYSPTAPTPLPQDLQKPGMTQPTSGPPTAKVSHNCNGCSDCGVGGKCDLCKPCDPCKHCVGIWDSDEKCAADCSAPCKSCEVCFVDCAAGQRCEVNQCPMAAMGLSEGEMYTQSLDSTQAPLQASASVRHTGARSLGSVVTVLALAALAAALVGAARRRFPSRSGHEYAPLTVPSEAAPSAAAAAAAAQYGSTACAL